MSIQIEAAQPIEVERGIPVTETRGRHPKYPFGEMLVGDAFALPLAGEAYSPTDYTDRTQRQVMCAAAMWARKYRVKFTTRILRGEGVVRCWRVA